MVLTLTVPVEWNASVSVPIRGLFNLTRVHTDYVCTQSRYYVSVPIRGLFNITWLSKKFICEQNHIKVSVPIRGLFNLTYGQTT